METLDAYLNDHGRPVAFYSDRHGIFRVNDLGREGELTQFSRAQTRPCRIAWSRN